MKKVLRIFIIALLVLFVVAQFFQPEKNQAEMGNDHLFKQADVPENMQTLLTNACLDCHSNQTNYLWYHYVSPVSWVINNHIVEGKEHLNLSEWGQMDVFDKIGTLGEMIEEVEKGEMPLKEYVLLHPKAKLDEAEVEALQNWTEKLSEELIANAE
jgi:hypothetical protein